MTEFNDDKPPVLTPEPPPAEAPRSPLYARLLNVIAMPSLVYEEVRVSRHSAGNWLLPLLLYAASLCLFGAVIFSTPTVQKLFDEMRPVWRKAQLEQVTGQVNAKKITQADADATMKAFDAVMQPEVARTIVAGSSLALGVARIFWWSLLVWFLARTALRTPIGFGKALEVVGLASVIASLGNFAIVALTLDFGKSFLRDGFALAVNDFPGSGSQVVVALLQNGLNFWLVAVMGTGLARLTGQPWFRGAFLIATYWIVTDIFLLALGAAFGR